ncbi:M15 family metallopeptidase [Kocuria flava]|uniref:M15 family metallopeptidase n=1 Tax=Kocuria flava TaxID=446860 RepID=UPI001FF6A7C4|nr:M15 family metallopeptidase [Kocuria flava]MCJ8505211.1 M15 family metallopeptidase [Kocuria flava]
MGARGTITGAATALLLTAGLLGPAAGATGVAADVDSAASTTVVVNKLRPLDPVDYVPADLRRVRAERLEVRAATAFDGLVRAAKRDGVNVVPISGYRSYAQQASLYDSYVRQYGQEVADTIAARPGHSEHQTGLAVDVGNASGVCALQDCFEGTPVGAWVADHAAEHGFVIRYPEGAEHVTGYAYEPWHLRYVGPGLAEELADRAAAEGPVAGTLEDYFGLPAAPDYAAG